MTRALKFFKKRIAKSNFANELAKCAEIAKKAYKRTLKYQQEVESIISNLNVNLSKRIFNLLDEKDAAHFEFSEVLKNMVNELKKYSENGLKDLKDAIETKRKHLKDFTITLFGRTKAGKSTIRESITKNGDGSTIGLGALHTTKEVGDYKWNGLRILDTPGVEGYGGKEEVEKAHEVIDQTDIVIFLTTDESQQPGEFEEMERLIEINKPFFVVLNVKDRLTDPAYLLRFLRKKGRLFDIEIIEEHKRRIQSETKRLGINNVDIIWISALASCIAQFAERGFNSQNREDFVSGIRHEQIRDIIQWFLNHLSVQDAHKLWKLSQIDKLFERIKVEVIRNGRSRRVLTFFDSTINFIDTIKKLLLNYHYDLKAQAEFMVEKQWELECFFDGVDFERHLKELMDKDVTEGKKNFLMWKLNRYIKRLEKKMVPEDKAAVESVIGKLNEIPSLIEKKDKNIFNFINIFEKYLPKRKGFVEESEEKIEKKCAALFWRVKEWVPDFVDEYLGKDNAQFVLNQKLNEEMKNIEKEMNGLIDEIVKELQTKLKEFTQQYQYDIGTIKSEFPDIVGFRKGQMGKILKWIGRPLSSIGGVILIFAATHFWNLVGWIAFGIGVVAGILSWVFEEYEKEKWLKAKREAKERLWKSIDKMERKTRGSYKTWFYENITLKGRKAMFQQVSTYIKGLFEITDALKKAARQLEELEDQMNKELFLWLLRLEGIKWSEKDILSIVREQGIATKIMLSNNRIIDPSIKQNLERLCGEHVLLFNDSNDIRERVAKALYPAKPSVTQIEIVKSNKQTIAKVKAPDEEKGLYIGKGGVNIRLAQKICGIKIEII